jgi:hypothetical protein
MNAPHKISQKLASSASRGAGRVTPDLRPGEPDADGIAPRRAEDGAGVQCAGVVASAPAQHDVLPDRPTGIQLQAEIRGFCFRRNLRTEKFGPLAGRSSGFVYALNKIAFPTLATVMACRAVMGTGDAPMIAVAMPGKYFGNFRTVSPLSGEITDFETLRAAAEAAAADRAARFAAVERAEHQHRLRGQALLRATPAAAFIAKARRQMEAK